LNNYRGITLLSTLYKLVTKILTNRMLETVDLAGAISDLQAGGRANRSCLSQVSLLTNVISHSHRRNHPLYLVSTDIRKAFDTVSYESFAASLRLVGYDEKVVNLIHNLQANFECVVRTPLGNTSPFKINQGCKQGCALSPLRFILVYGIFF
jgi:hypothetical protein